jgi:hypothetical protein
VKRSRTASIGLDKLKNGYTDMGQIAGETNWVTPSPDPAAPAAQKQRTKTYDLLSQLTQQRCGA